MARKIGFLTASSIIVSSMVGTGVYTSLGYQVIDIKSVPSILLLWVLGGIMSLCGALTYGELAIRFPRSGGEYNFLSKIYHPSIGFLSGWVSCTVGFATPAALSAMAFADYFNRIFEQPFINQTSLAALVIVFVSLINIVSVKVGGNVQKTLTITNLSLVVIFILFGFLSTPATSYSFELNIQSFEPVFTIPFATSLVYVSYAYSGWNTITYISGEVENPGKILPKSLFWAPFLVMILYVLLNFVFLYSTPIHLLEGENEVGYIAGKSIFGENGGFVICIIICITLLASVNSFTFAGPRVTKIIGEDFPFLAAIANINKGGSPIYAILIQSAIALLLIVTSTFDKVLVYIGFTLSLFTTLTVAGIFVLRFKEKKGEQLPYRVPFYPLVPLVFLALELWMIAFTLIHKPLQSFAGLLTIGLGIFVYYFLAKEKQKITPAATD